MAAMAGGRGRAGRGRRAGPAPPSPPSPPSWRPLRASDAECPVCRHTLAEPARLPCGHRFCLRCVRSAVCHGAGCCPLCRARCAGWLRRATLTGTLVDQPLWDYIRAKFPSRAEDPDHPDHPEHPEHPPDPPPEAVRRQISAPGEIKSEFEAELRRMRNERKLLENKYKEENDKLIEELQEQERRELQSQSTKIEEDEKLARQLSVELNDPPEVRKAGFARPAQQPPSKKFYTHLGKPANGFEPDTLDCYVLRSNEKPETKPNLLRGMSGSTMTATSPELVSTAGRCGRFLRNFLNGRLWGFNADARSAPHCSGSSKFDPKVWEPQKICSNGDGELSVSSGIVVQRNATMSRTVKLNPVFTSSFKLKIDSDIESEDSISQELRYFKPIHPSPVCRFSGKLIRIHAMKNKIDNPHIPNETVPDKLLIIKALDKLKNDEISTLGFNSAFVCCLTIPESHIKLYKNNTNQSSKSPSKKSNNKIVTRGSKTCIYNDTNVDISKNQKIKNTVPKKNGLRNYISTPKKTSPMRTRSNKQSQTFPKYDIKNDKLQSRVSSRLKRSLSFNEDKPHALPKCSSDEIYTNGDVNDKDTEGKSSDCTNIKYNKKLRSNGHVKKNGDVFPEQQSAKTRSKVSIHLNGKSNGTGESKADSDIKIECDIDFSLNNIDQSVLREQKRIEEMIAQEKKDLALAKKLQRQLGGQVINTGYTLRTAAKRQATLTELLPPSKNMRI